MKTCPPPKARIAYAPETCHRESDYIQQPFDIPDSSERLDEPDDPSDLEDFDCDQDDDTDWEVFIPDDDEFNPEPDPRDFWRDFSSDE